ncbi:Phosphatidylethanolamine-binding protein PEBP [Penicillium italicum]|uniref:Phosphatidylethanolamine-binding protein PEBP n=1 Tax=Penicillium italicum TaxID=40296 RepID=A0A0A2L5Y8_PENIT|nr:Phosphatidylethanolamine-binding protein PEBP [Penicillium italicum]
MRVVLSLYAIAAAATAASAGTVPPELAVIGEPSTILNVTYSVGSSEFSFKPGDFLNTTVSKDAPQPHLHELGLSATNRYLLLMVDPDWNKTSPPSVIVHTVVANLTTNVNSTGNEKVIATYIAPQPKSGTHNYTLLLFNQPSNFSVPVHYESFMETTDQTPLNRLNLPLESFINQTGLGAPVAANYFRVTASNSTSTGTTTTTTSSGTAGAAASSTSSGAAIKMVTSHYLAGAVIVTV